MELKEQNVDKNEKIKSLIQKNIDLEGKIAFLDLSLNSLKEYDDEDILDAK